MDSSKNAAGAANEHTEEQKKHIYDQLPEEERHKQSYTEWVKEVYHDQYEKWVPWLEDQYLKWFSKDNKASYATKDTLDKTKVTGVSQIDQLQGDVNNLVGNQFGQEGFLRPVGDAVSKEGINRTERGGKDESGSSFGGPVSGISDPVINSTQKAGQSVAGGMQTAGSTAAEGVKGAGGYLGGMLGGGEKK